MRDLTECEGFRMPALHGTLVLARRWGRRLKTCIAGNRESEGRLSAAAGYGDLSEWPASFVERVP